MGVQHFAPGLFTSSSWVWNRGISPWHLAENTENKHIFYYKPVHGNSHSESGFILSGLCGFSQDTCSGVCCEILQPLRQITAALAKKLSLKPTAKNLILQKCLFLVLLVQLVNWFDSSGVLGLVTELQPCFPQGKESPCSWQLGQEGSQLLSSALHSKNNYFVFSLGSFQCWALNLEVLTLEVFGYMGSCFHSPSWTIYVHAGFLSLWLVYLFVRQALLNGVPVNFSSDKRKK